MKEIWKPVAGYEGFYEVSNQGRVKRTKNLKETILKSCKHNNGYLKVMLCKNGKRQNVFIHRIVAQTFIQNPDDLPQVNHIDGNKENNITDNLEWVTHSENMMHAVSQKLFEPFFNRKTRAVCQYSIEGGFIRKYSSVMEAQRQTGIDRSSIQKCCSNKQKTAGGYVWKYGE